MLGLQIGLKLIAYDLGVAQSRNGSHVVSVNIPLDNNIILACHNSSLRRIALHCQRCFRWDTLPRPRQVPRHEHGSHHKALLTRYGER